MEHLPALSKHNDTQVTFGLHFFFFFWKPSIVSPTQGDREKHGRKEARHVGWAGTDKWKELDRLRNQKGGVKEKLAREKGRKRNQKGKALGNPGNTCTLFKSTWEIRAFAGEAGR